MCKALSCFVLVACGGAEPAVTSAPPEASSSSQPSSTPEQRLPPVTKVGDDCRLSKDCNPLGRHHRCMRTSTGSHCFESPMKVCDAPDCSCFNNDPCLANDLGTCTGYQTGVVICSK